MDADRVGEREVAEIAALECWRSPSKSASACRPPRPPDDGADVAVEKVFVVVVAQLNDFVARAIFAARGAQPARIRVQGRLELNVQLPTPAMPLCIGARIWTSWIGCGHLSMRGMKSVTNCCTLRMQSSASLAAMKLRSAHTGAAETSDHDRRQRRIAGVDRVRGRDDQALALLPVDHGKPRDCGYAGGIAGGRVRKRWGRRLADPIRSFNTLPAPTLGS